MDRRYSSRRQSLAPGLSIANGRRQASLALDTDIEAGELYGKRPSRSLRTRMSQNNTIASRWAQPDENLITPYDPLADVKEARANAKKSRNLSIFSLFRYASWVDWILMFCGFCFALIAGITVMTIFYWLSKIMTVMVLHMRCISPLPEEQKDKELLDGFVDEVWKDAWILAAVIFLCNYLAWRCFAWSADRQTKQIFCKYFEWTLRKDMAWYDNYVDREFSHMMTDDINAIRAGIGEVLAELAYFISAISLTSTAMFLFNYQLSFGVLAMSIICMVLVMCGTYAHGRVRGIASKVYDRSGSLAEEILSNIKTIKIFQAEMKEVSRFEIYLKSANSKELKWILITALSSALAWISIHVLLAVTIWLGTTNVVIDDTFCTAELKRFKESFDDLYYIDSDLTYPSHFQALVMFMLAIIFVSTNTMDIPYFIKQVWLAKTNASEVFFLIDWKPRIDNLSEEGRAPKSSSIGRLELDNLGFRYPRKYNEWAIRNISMALYPGQIIGLAGNPNSGKSTVFKLILRLYDACEGQIMLDGINIQSYNVRWLRSQILLMTQNPIIMPGTIEENLKFVKMSANLEEMQAACKRAHIHDEIMSLPEQYQTMLTVTGLGNRNVLTEAQVRKLCIARIFLVKPKILLLDYPLTTDKELELLILDTIKWLGESTTVLVSSSKVNQLMKQCDIIYMFKKGKIEETGTHAELVRESEDYFKMIEDNIIDTVEGVKPKFTSQLSEYKFAKTLRRINEQKRKTIGINMRESNENIMGTIRCETSASSEPAKYHGFGIGGFLRYTFAKSEAFNPRRVGNLVKGLKSLRKNNRTKKKKRFGSFQKERKSFDDSYSTANNQGAASRASFVSRTGSQDNSTFDDVQSEKYSYASRKSHTKIHITSLGSGGIHVARVSSHAISNASTTIGNVPMCEKDLNADEISICSKDSQEFWDDYCKKLENVKHKEEVGTWKYLFGFGKEEWIWILYGSLASIVLGIKQPMCFFLIGKMCMAFAVLDVDKRNEEILQLCLYFFGIGIVAGLAEFFQELFFCLAGRNMLLNLRIKLLTVMLHKDIQWYDNTENDISILVSRLASDADCIQHVLLINWGVALQVVTSLIISVAMSFALSFGSECIFLLETIFFVIPAIILSAFYSGRLMYTQVEIMDSKLEETSELAYTAITSIRGSIILGLERYWLEKFNASLIKPFRYFYFISEMRCLLTALSRTLPWLVCGMFVCNGLGFVNQLMKGHFSDTKYFEYLFSVCGMIIFTLNSIGRTLALLTSLSVGKDAASKISRIMNPKVDIPFDDDVDKNQFNDFKLKEDPPKLQLIDISYQYPAAKDKKYEVLRNINLTILPKSYIAVVGYAESGKTTLASIFLRLRDSTTGTYLVDGQNADSIPIKSLRKIMALVEQDPGLMHNMSISENIVFGDSTKPFDQEKIIEVAKVARIHDEILNFKYGYDTKISIIDAKVFTYAFKQRLALARALFSDPKILVFDDATSFTETKNSEAMQEAIKDAKADRTLIIFSETIKPIRGADKIYVMESGQIVEDGNDSTLLDSLGLYYNMLMSQRLAQTAAEFSRQDNSFINTSDPEARLKLLQQKQKSEQKRQKRKSSIAYSTYLSAHINEVRKGNEERKQKAKSLVVSGERSPRVSKSTADKK